MEALVEFFKKHKALAWIGVGVLAIAAYIIGKSTVPAPATTTTDTSTSQPTGSYNYYYTQATQPATTATPATPAATTTTDTSTPQPTYVIQQPPVVLPISGPTLGHPSGIVDNSTTSHHTTQPAKSTAKYVTVTKWPAPGSSLSSIASMHGISLPQIEKLNPQYKSNYNLIYPGQQVRIS